MSEYSGLSNEQLVFIYLRLAKYAQYVDELMLDAYSTRKLTIGFGHVQTQTDVTDDDLEVIMNIPVVQMYMSIEKSLSPIVNIIKDADPALYDKIKEMILEAESASEFQIENFENESEEDDDEFNPDDN
jgi:hypothetical protein